MDFEGISAFVEGHKSFVTGPQGFELIRPVNVIIGRNNSGKSALIDLLEGLCRNLSPSSTQPPLPWRESPGASVKLAFPIREEAIARTFPKGMAGGGEISGDHYEFGQKWLGHQLSVVLGSDGGLSFDSRVGGDDQRHSSEISWQVGREPPPIHCTDSYLGVSSLIGTSSERQTRRCAFRVTEMG